VTALEPSPFERATRDQLASKRFHRTRRNELRMMPREFRALRSPTTGRVRQVPVLLCPVACGESGACPVPQPYYPGEHASEVRQSAWDRRVEYTEAQAQGTWLETEVAEDTWHDRHPQAHGRRAFHPAALEASPWDAHRRGRL